MNFLDKKWDELKTDEENILKDERERKLREIIPSIIFLVTVILSTYFTHFLAFAFRNQIDIAKKYIPFTKLWSYFEVFISQNIGDILVIPLIAAGAFVIIGLITVAILRQYIKRTKCKIASLCPETKNLDSAIIWAKTLKKRLRLSPRYSILAIIIAILWIIGITAIIIYKFKDTTVISDQCIIGWAEVLIYWVAWCVVNRFAGVPKYRWSSHFNYIIKEINEEKEKQLKINKLFELYIDDKHEEVRELLKDYEDSKLGDICALKILTAKLETDTTEQVRNSYDSLWKAKDLGFVNDKIRQDVNEWLDVLTPMVKVLAQEDILKAYKLVIDDNTNQIILHTSTHYEYGHPDAVVLQIFSYINSDDLNEPKRYEAWLKDLKNAKRRGIVEELQEITETLIGKLENQIRINKEIEKKEKEREAKIASYYTPTYSMGGPLSSWAEPSGWEDFRTGEPLYRVEGRIVNANGEEVSVAWWD